MNLNFKNLNLLNLLDLVINKYYCNEIFIINKKFSKKDVNIKSNLYYFAGTNLHPFNGPIP